MDKGKKILFPPIWITVILTLISTIALIIIFIKGCEMSPVAYICYVLAFYTLIVICAACIKYIPGCVKSIKMKLHKNKYTARYLTDVVYKTKINLHSSLVINLIYAAVNAASGIIYQTHWFGIFAAYYGIIAVMKYLLVGYVNLNPIGKDLMGELKRARLCAYVLLTINLALSGAVLMMIYFDRGFRYQGFMIYVIALYTFYITTTAIIDMIKYRKYHSPIMSITKMIKLTSALFSMLFLETAMFAQFGLDTPLETKQIMISVTGAGICVVVVVMAICMIARTSKEMKVICSER